MANFFRKKDTKRKMSLFLSILMVLSCISIPNTTVNADTLDTNVEIVSTNTIDEVENTLVDDSEKEQIKLSTKTKSAKEVAGVKVFDEDYGVNVTEVPSWVKATGSIKDGALAISAIPADSKGTLEFDLPETAKSVMINVDFNFPGSDKYVGIYAKYEDGTYNVVSARNNKATATDPNIDRFYILPTTTTPKAANSGSVAKNEKLSNTANAAGFNEVYYSIIRKDDGTTDLALEVLGSGDVITSNIPTTNGDAKITAVGLLVNSATYTLNVDKIAVWDLDGISAPAENPVGPLNVTNDKGAISLNWTANQAGDNVAGYKVKLTDTTLNKESEYTISGYQTDSLLITNHADGTALKNGNAYTVSVSTYSGAGVNTNPLTGGITLNLAAPTGVTATPGPGTITLNWTNDANATGNNVYLGSQKLNDTPIENNTFIYSVEPTGSAITFTVKGVNLSGEGAGADVSGTAGALTSAPEKPILRAEGGDGKVTLTWASVPTATKYIVYVNGTAEPELGNVTTYTKTGLTNGTEYTFELVAKNSFLPSEKSTAVKVTPVKPSFTLKANAWIETGYANWADVPGATGYEAYWKKASDADSAYKKVDTELVRKDKKNGGNRVDVLGLPGGIAYNIKVVALGLDGTEAIATVTPRSHDRRGFAFSSASPMGKTTGGYNADGSVPDNAEIIYVTPETINAGVFNVSGLTNQKLGNAGNGAGLFPEAKRSTTKPLIVRFIGMNNVLPQGIGSENGLDIKETQNVTFEGVGDDAVIDGWGLISNKSSNIVIRNLTFQNFVEDAIGVKGVSTNNWINNCTFLIGAAGSGDKAKGDGSTDVKDKATYYTISYNHYIESGKCQLAGMKDEDDSVQGSYHHNWYDRSGSRHPRVRTGNMHVFNNYYLGNTTYAVGAAMDSSILVQNNYFENVKKPFLISGQGHSLDNYTGTGQLGGSGGDMMSGEAGAAIRIFGNYLDEYSSSWVDLNYDVGDSKSNSYVYRVAKLGLVDENGKNPVLDSHSPVTETPQEAKETVIEWAGVQSFVDPLATPPTVTGLKVAISEEEEYILSWDTNVAAEGYVIESNISGSWATFAKISGKASSYRSAEASAKADSEVSFRVIASNENGLANASSIATIAYKSPASPTNLVLTAAPGTITASWTVPAGVSSFKVVVKLGDEVIVSGDRIYENSYSLENLAEGTYTITVYSVNGKLESATPVSGTSTVAAAIKKDDLLDVIANDDFSGETLGELPATKGSYTWELNELQSDTGTGSVHKASYEKLTKDKDADNQVLRLNDFEVTGGTTSGRSLTFNKNFTPTTAKRATVSVDYVLTGGVTSSQAVMKLQSSDGKTIIDYKHNSATNPAPALGEWVNLKIVLDFDTHKYDLYVNGVISSANAGVDFADPTANDVAKFIGSTTGKNSSNANGERSVNFDNFFIAQAGADTTPTAPTGLVIASSPTTTSKTFSFTEVTGADSYKLYYGADDDTLTKAIIIPAGTTTATITDLPAGSNYRYAIATTKGNVTGALSATIGNDNTVDGPQVTDVTANPTNVVAAGGTATINITGTKLNEATSVSVKKTDSETKTTATVSSATAATAQVTIAPNNTTTARTDTFEVFIGGTSTGKTVSITVAPKTEDPIVASVTAVSPTNKTFDNKGGEQVITITGENLTKAGTIVSVKNGTDAAITATVANATTATVKVTVPENTSTTTDKVYEYKVLLNNADTTYKSTITVSAKTDVVDPTPTITRVTPLSADVAQKGETVDVVVTGTNLTTSNIELSNGQATIRPTISNNGTTATFEVVIPENDLEEEVTFRCVVVLSGSDTDNVVTLTQAAKPKAAVTSVSPVTKSLPSTINVQTITVTGVSLTTSNVKLVNGDQVLRGSISDDGKTASFKVEFPTNNTDAVVTTVYTVQLNGENTDLTSTFNQAAKPATVDDTTTTNGGSSITKKPVNGSTTNSGANTGANTGSNTDSAKVSADSGKVTDAANAAKAEGKTTVEVAPAKGETSVGVNAETVKSLVDSKLDLKVASGDVAVTVPTTELQKLTNSEVTVDVEPATVTNDEITAKFDSVDAANQTLFEKTFSDIKLNNGKANVAKFDNSLTLTFDLSSETLTDEQIKNLSVVRVLDQASGKVEYLGGKYDPETKIFTAQTAKLSQYAVVIADPSELTRIDLQVGNKNYDVNDTNKTSDVAPQIIGGSTYVPVRFVAESLNGVVGYDVVSKNATITIDGKTINIKAGETIKGTDMKPVLVDSRTLVPLRAISELLGANVNWYANDKSIEIVK